MMRPPGLQSYLRRRVILNFDLLTPKVDRFLLVPHGPLVLIGNKIGSVVFKISCSQTLEQTVEVLGWGRGASAPSLFVQAPSFPPTTYYCDP